jgi:hypothetical protein
MSKDRWLPTHRFKNLIFQFVSWKNRGEKILLSRPASAIYRAAGKSWDVPRVFIWPACAARQPR